MRNFIRIMTVAVIVCITSNAAIAAQTFEAKRTRDAYAPFEEILQITPSDVTVFTPPLRGCIVEIAGDLVINTIKGDAAIGVADVTITVLVGQVVPAIIDQVMAATTATVVCGR